MSDRAELKRLAEAFPSDLDWDSNTEPFFNGPSGESLGGGADGTYTVYGKPFRLEGEDYDYDGPTYFERCGADFAKFMVAARDGVLSLIAENERLESEAVYSAAGFDAAREEIARLKVENEALRKDAERWRFFSVLANDLQAFPHSWGQMTPEKMDYMCDEAMASAMSKEPQP